MNQEPVHNTASPGLKRSFGLKMAIIIVISTIVGSGVFKKVAPMADVLGAPYLVIIAFALAGLLTLFGMWSIAELGTLYPDSGGPFSWLEKVYGKPVSFLYGWASFTVIQTAAISSIAFVFAGALSTFIPLPQLSGDITSVSFLGIIKPFENIGGKLVACLLIILLTIVNIRGAKRGGNLSMVFTVIIILCILTITGVAFGSATGSTETFATPAFHIGELGFLGMCGAMVIAMRHAFWAYEGWLALGFIGEELHQPEKNIPRAMTIGMLIIITLYLLINAAYLYVLPVQEMLAEISLDENKIAAVLVVDKMFGNGGAYVISAMILVSTLGCTNATILVSSRIYYAMAQKGLFFKNIGRTHSKHSTPANSLILQCIWGCILVFSGSFDLLTDLVIIAAFVFYGLIVFGVIILRKRKKDLHRPYKTLGYPFVPVIFTLFCVLLLGVTFVESPEKSIIGLILIFSGLPFYYYWKRKYRGV